MRISLLALAAFSLLNVTFASAETPWNQFRGGDGSGISDAQDLPEEIGEKTNVKWKTPLAGKAWSSPVVWEKQIWVTNATEDGKKLSAVCLDFDSGKIVHDIVVFEIEKPMFCYPLNSYGSPTPAVEAGRVYVSYGSAGTACLDTKTGETLWSRQDLKCDHFRGPASSPVLHGDHMLLHFDGFDVQFVVALDKKTGDTVWKKDRAFDFKVDNGDNKKAYGTPAVFKLGEREVAICPAAVATESFDAKTGELLWTVRHDGMNASARPLFGNGLIYITNGMGRIVAVKPEGSGDITQSIAWTSHKAVAKKASPLLLGERLYMITDDGIATCLDANNGEQKWMKRLGGEFAASPVYGAGKIYFFSMGNDSGGEGIVIKAGDEYEEVSRGKFDAGFMASPAIAEKSLIVRSKEAIYRLAK